MPSQGKQTMSERIAQCELTFAKEPPTWLLKSRWPTSADWQRTQDQVRRKMSETTKASLQSLRKVIMKENGQEGKHWNDGHINRLYRLYDLHVTQTGTLSCLTPEMVAWYEEHKLRVPGNVTVVQDTRARATEWIYRDWRPKPICGKEYVEVVSTTWPLATYWYDRLRIPKDKESL